MRASRIVVFSLQKSGTHLIQELIRSLDYRIVGQSRLAAEDEPTLTSEERERIAAVVHGRTRCAFWKLTGRFVTATDDLWLDLLWSWQARLGTPMGSRYDHSLTERSIRGDRAEALQGTTFSLTPARLCWMLHDPPFERIDGAFLREWAETGQPRVIYNYRDPRDVLLSFVNYLCGATGRGFGRFNEFQTFSRTLLSLPDTRSRLLYAIEDPSFPGHDAFKQGIWLLRHPNVCKVRFEDLVGPNGGGTESAQLETVAAVLAHLGIEDDPRTHAARLFNPQAFTFYRGQIGAWREFFDHELIQLFKKEFQGVVEAYGYSWLPAAVATNGKERDDVYVAG
jgi:hypothetical protein